MMAVLCRLKTVGFAVAVRDPHLLLKPFSHCCLPNQFVRHSTTTSSPAEISPKNQQHADFTVNYLTNSCGLSPEGAISASKWLNLKSSEKADNVLGLLRNHGLSETQISKLVKSYSVVLGLNPEKILLPKIDYLRSVGVSREELARILAYNPGILTRSLEKRIIPTFDFLTSMLTHKNALAVFKRSSSIFLEGHSKNVVPNIGLLRELGMPQSRISLLLTYGTRSLMLRPEKFEQVVNEVKQMGFSLENSNSVSAISLLYGNNSKLIWNRSRQVYMTRWGWSEDDVLYAFSKYPECMFKSEKKIMQVMEFLVNEMGWSSGVIARLPVVLGLSLEKRIIPRCSVVKVLLLKGFINEIQNLSLSTVLVPAEKRFLKMFVAKYIDQVPQLLSVYQGKLGVEDV